MAEGNSESEDIKNEDNVQWHPLVSWWKQVLDQQHEMKYKIIKQNKCHHDYFLRIAITQSNNLKLIYYLSHNIIHLNIQTLPRMRTKSATTLTAATLRMFLKIRKNARREDLQKEEPYIDVWMYAFLFTNLAQFSRHHIQHCKTHNRYSTILLLLFFACFCMYASTARIVFIIAIISEPKAAVPRWYRNTVLDDC